MVAFYVTLVQYQDQEIVFGTNLYTLFRFCHFLHVFVYACLLVCYLYATFLHVEICVTDPYTRAGLCITTKELAYAASYAPMRLTHLEKAADSCSESLFSH